MAVNEPPDDGYVRAVQRSALKAAVRVMLMFAVLAAVAIWAGERLVPQKRVEAPLFWLQGQRPWAPDEGRCAFCGSALVPRVDAVSACRYCEVCKVSYRHRTLPKTIEEMERVWK